MLYFRFGYVCLFLAVCLGYYLYIVCHYALGQNVIARERMSPFLRRLPIVRSYIDKESKKFEPNVDNENDECAICMEKFDPAEK